jgi:hypothetical protein
MEALATGTDTPRIGEPVMGAIKPVREPVKKS